VNVVRVAAAVDARECVHGLPCVLFSFGTALNMLPLLSMPLDGQRFVKPHRHAVKFYATESSLVSTVAGFVSEGMILGQPAVMIAIPAHREAVSDELSVRNIDVEHARRRGDLVMLDARETLDLFMIDGEPNAPLFTTYVGGILDQMIRGRGPTIVRAYGEMVDLLWKDGQPDAAIQLEILWNALARKHGFALLCAYCMGNFYKQTEQFEEVCRQHSHVIDGAVRVSSFV
jgi:hypothetical protein